MTGTSDWTVLRDFLPIVQTGMIVLLGAIGRKVIELTDRLARIEEQVEDQKDKLKVIDERCFTVLRDARRGHHDRST